MPDMRKARSRRFLTPQQKQFIENYVYCGGIVTRACKMSSVTSATYYNWEKKKHFRDALIRAKDRWEQTLAAALIKRGMEKSDRAAEFMLEALNPKVYDKGVRKQELANQGIVEAFENLPTPVFITRKEDADDDFPPPRAEFEALKHGCS